MTVRPTGPRGATLALIGEAPGAEEAKQGIPFVGAAGRMLNQMLAATGINRDSCYITNVSHERPPQNDFVRRYYHDAKGTKPRPELADEYVRLATELDYIRPDLIIALGEQAMRATTAQRGITNHRGMIIDTFIMGEPVRVMSTFHPANILYMYGNRPILELDLKKALRQAKDPYKPPTNFQTHPTFNEVMDWLDKRHSPVSFDIETLRNPITIRRIGFGWSASEAISIPLMWGGSHAWSIEEETLILQGLNTYLGDPEIKKYVQNLPFDTTVVATELGLHVNGIVLDTMYAQHLLYPELPKSLDFLCSIRTDFHRYWEHKNLDDEHNAEYNCYDLCVTWISAEEIIDELDERGLMKFYDEHTHPTIFAITRMQNRGIRMDVSAREGVRTLTEDKMKIAQMVLNGAANREVNANSPKQVMELIYNEWHLPVQKDLKTKRPTTDDDALRTLSRKFPARHDSLRAILECRQTRKLISTYIDAELDGGYVRTSYGIAVTGRLTSSKTIEGFGGNLQNIPRGEFRRLYIPDEGKILIVADLSQAEYMVFCWDALVLEFIRGYTNDPTFDVHRLNAARFYEIEQVDVTKEQRYKSKQSVYAGNYRIGAIKFAKMHDVEYGEAKRLLDGYQESRPELRVWWTRIEDEIKTTRTLTNIFGRERIFFGRIDNSLFRAAYDWICQSTVADLINAALVVLDAGDEVDVLLQVHDELVCQCDDNPTSIATGVKAIRKAMERPLMFPRTDVPMVIPAEIAVGPNWYDVTEYKEVV